MANTKSALKRAKQNLVRRARNVNYRSFVRSRVRMVREAIASGDSTKAQELLRNAASALHKVAGKGIIHPRSADRKLSRLSQQVSAMSSGEAQS